MPVEITDFNVKLLESLLTQRLNELLDGLHKPELKGKLAVQIVRDG